MHMAVATAFDDTFRVMIVAAVAGAVLGLALRRPRAVHVEAEDDAALPTPAAA
jgi:hypothetical protein